MRGDLRVLQQHQRDHAVVLRGFRVIEDGGDLREVAGAEGEIDRPERLGSEESERLGIDFQNFLSAKIYDLHAALADAFVFRLIRAQGERILVVKFLFAHRGISLTPPSGD